MKDIKNSKNIVYIPGWMDRGEIHGYWNSRDVWAKERDVQLNSETRYVIGHSVGALIALDCWQKKKDLRLILVGPLVPRRSYPAWLWRWVKFVLYEGIPLSLERMKTFLYIVQGTVRMVRLMHIDPFMIIEQIPRENVLIIRGKDDLFFCDEEAMKIFKEKGVPVVEIDGAGHNWHPKIDTAIEEYLLGKV
ncbi:MAG: alpha/beta hydrolase [bacterium]|nr:alpha/beta hydrolase [bacterium]